MPLAPQRIAPCLWFDTEAEDAAKFYCTVFDNSRIVTVSRYGEEGHDIHGKPAGTVMAVEFQLDGQTFAALNGGPQFKFSEAISFQIRCKDQAEVDRYWAKLTADGGEEGPCGWLKDRFGLSWQIVPAVLFEMLTDKDHAASQRVTKAFLQMKKFDIAALRRAFEGEPVA
jgi:predicted 3-demethylubiquinone-9 3-methyltransferase (glyoxalase superfamily)